MIKRTINMQIPYKDKYPTIATGVFIAPTAVIIGDVEIAEGANIWYGTVLRGDLAPIRIGANTNVQDNCTIHTDVNKPAIIGPNVTVGHNAVVHGCTIEDRCLIGMNAVVLSGAHIKSGCIVGAGAVVKEDQVAGPFQLLAGIPAVVKKEFTADSLKIMDRSVAEYLALAKDHRQTMGLYEAHNSRV
jgi:carbonic anhydrase/acetyltransferase-like protein (isoleucine patch superfamily)